MNPAWAYTLISVLAVSLISLVGIFFVFLRKEWLEKILLFLVSFSAGALLGGAFIHLLPEAARDFGFNLNLSLSLLSGLLAFFILEKFICWHHCHIPSSDRHYHPLTYLSLVGDGLHNFIDGMVIAGSYLAGFPLGLATTLAIILHEVPQEIGDFGMLLYGGLSRRTALALNFASALTAFLGALFVLFLSAKIGSLTAFLLPFTAGGFIYIAGSDLIPEMQKETELKGSVFQLFSLLLGIGLMLTTLLLHH